MPFGWRDGIDVTIPAQGAGNFTIVVLAWSGTVNVPASFIDASTGGRGFGDLTDPVIRSALGAGGSKTLWRTGESLATPRTVKIAIDPERPLSTGWADTVPLGYIVAAHSGSTPTSANRVWFTHNYNETVVMRNTATVGVPLPALTLPSYTQDRVIGHVDRIFSTPDYDTGETRTHSVGAASPLVRPRIQTDTGKVLVTTGSGQAFSTITATRTVRGSSEIVPALSDSVISSATQLNIAAPGVIPDVPPPDLPLPATGVVSEIAAPDTSVIDWNQTRVIRLADVFAYESGAPVRVSVPADRNFVQLAITGATASTQGGYRLWDFDAQSNTEITISFSTATAPAGGWAAINEFDLVFDFGTSAYAHMFAMQVLDNGVHEINVIPNMEVLASQAATAVRDLAIADLFTAHPDGLGVTRTYSVDNTAPLRATGSISGTVLSVATGSQVGIAEVRVTATDTPDPAFAGLAPLVTTSIFSVAVRSVITAQDNPYIATDFYRMPLEVGLDGTATNGAAFNVVGSEVGVTATWFDAAWCRLGLATPGGAANRILPVTSGRETQLSGGDQYSRTWRFAFDAAQAPAGGFAARNPVRITWDKGSGVPFSVTVDAVLVDRVAPTARIPDYDVPATLAETDLIDAASFFAPPLARTSAVRSYRATRHVPFGYAGATLQPPRRGGAVWASPGGVHAGYLGSRVRIAVLSAGVADFTITATDTKGSVTESFSQTIRITAAAATAAVKARDLPTDAVQVLRQLPTEAVGWQGQLRVPLSRYFKWRDGVSVLVAHTPRTPSGDRINWINVHFAGSISNVPLNEVGTLDLRFNPTGSGFTLPATGFSVENPGILSLLFRYGTETLRIEQWAITMLMLRAPVVISALPRVRIGTGETDYFVGNVADVFDDDQTDTDATVRYAAASSNASVAARVDDQGRILLTTGASTARADVTISSIATSGARFTPAISRQADAVFGVEFATTAPLQVSSQIGTRYLYSYERDTVNLLDHFTNTDGFAIENLRVLTPGGTVASGSNLHVDVQIAATSLVINADRVTALQSNRVEVTANSSAGVQRIVTFDVKVLPAQGGLQAGTLSQTGVYSSSAYHATLALAGAVVPTGLSPITYRWRVTADGYSQVQHTTAPTVTFDLPPFIGDAQPIAWVASAEVRAEGFASAVVQRAFSIAPRVSGSAQVTASGDIVFNYRIVDGAAARDVTASDVIVNDVHVFGNDRYDHTPAVTQQPGAAPQAHFDAAHSGLQQVVVDFSVGGLALVHRETVNLTGTVADHPAGTSYRIGDQDVTADVQRFTYARGRTVSSGVLQFVSGGGQLTFRTQLQASDLLGKRVRYYESGVLRHTAWVSDVEIVHAQPRRARLRLHGLLATASGEAVNYAALAPTQAEALEQIMRSAGFFTSRDYVAHSDGAALPPCNFVGGLLASVHAVEAYGGAVSEDQYGRLAFGNAGTAPASFALGIGKRSDTVAAVISQRDLDDQHGAAFNAADLPAAPMTQVPHITTQRDGAVRLGGFVFYTDLALNSGPAVLQRNGVIADVSPTGADATLIATLFNRTDGTERLNVELPRGSDVHRNNLPARLAPLFGVSAADQRTAVLRVLQAIRDRDLHQVNVIQPLVPQHAALSLNLARTMIGMTTELNGVPGFRIEWERTEDARDNTVRREVLLNV